MRLEKQMAAIVQAEFQMAESVAAMRKRGVQVEHIEYWQDVCRNLAAARETLRLVMVAEEARAALVAHMQEPTP